MGGYTNGFIVSCCFKCFCFYFLWVAFVCS